jgi:hypothetical protein
MGIINWPSSVVTSGDIYGRLTVISTHKKGANRYLAKCQCNCGSEPFYVRIDALRKQSTVKRPATKSCGCLSVETATKHGLSMHPLYNHWHHMMIRCYDEKRSNYKYYGGRGITVCIKWHNLKNFIVDMSEGYKKGLQLERVNNNKDYSKDNCCWATRKEQMRNTRHNHCITFNGKTRCIAEWAEMYGLNPPTLLHRIRQGRLTIEQCITTPVYKTRCLL